ncbi:MAG: hypothetical protein JST33_00580 [Actinobacteria bacterium]|nr:hypothetical protein [Actinomycetota bacterium]
MAGRFVYWMNVSLDLRIEATPGERRDPVVLDLLEQAAYGEGVTMHRYAVRR